IAPGFIDLHDHFLGGGGGTGFASRVPQIQLSQFMRAGITTAVAGLGFDATTKQLEALLGVAKGLEEEGMTTYIYCGATCTHPIVTFTGQISRDMVLIDKVIGVGEVSLSEMGPSLESMGPGYEYIARLAAEVFQAGRMTGKAGVVCLQVPAVKRGLDPLFDILETTGLPPAVFIPAHANSRQWYFDQVMRFAKLGGWCDLTSSYTSQTSHPGSIKPSRALVAALKADVPLDRITMSTDGGGGFPLHDKTTGKAKGTHYLSVGTMHTELRDMVLRERIPLSEALQVITSNPARALKLSGRKGALAEGLDADLVIMDKDLNIDAVYARGRQMVKGGKPVVKGMWEDLLSREV
ncbi:MAG: amidohydrolase family protein, partial [Candidatus Latescibacterota bacterium]